MSPLLPNESIRQRLAQQQQAHTNLQGQLQHITQPSMPTEVSLPSQNAAREAALAAMIASSVGNPGTFTSSYVDGKPAVIAHGTNGESGVVADSDIGVAVSGVSDQGPQSIGIKGHSKGGWAVFGQSDTGTGVSGVSSSGTGVDARSDSFTGLYAASNSGTAIIASSNSGVGIQAHGGQYAGMFQGNANVPNAVAVAAASDSSSGIGIYARGGQNAGVFGGNVDITGTVSVSSDSSTAVVAVSNSGIGIQVQGGQIGIQAVQGAGQYAGDFQGAVNVNGNINVAGDVILTGADCAEEFDISEAVDIEPGTVMVLDQEGGLQQSQRAYDKKVAGVISGAGTYRPGLILDRQQARNNRLPVALVGKVYCKVDAQYAPIEVGDLLTTSSTPGHAMKANDPLQAFGSVIGKALRPLEVGQGLIPILIALQ